MRRPRARCRASPATSKKRSARAPRPPLTARLTPRPLSQLTRQLDHIDRHPYDTTLCTTWVFIILLLENNICTGDGTKKSFYHYRNRVQTTGNPFTKTICMKMENTLRARHKSCFLRPDTGPCRGDILQWYYDVIQAKCFRFYWGGCQGNGNKFETENECIEYCILNSTLPQVGIPHFCRLSFDYGTCFGYFPRWSWDTFSKSCKQRIYSGCGGNQNNFETRKECTSTCLNPPNSTLNRIHQYTTCVPYNIVDML